MRVLEIGCGWGGFAAYAAGELGWKVVGVTIAEEQAEYARKNIAYLGLTDRVEIRLEDFRETTESFDAVISIEMIESIDETQWRDAGNDEWRLPVGSRARPFDSRGSTKRRLKADRDPQVTRSHAQTRPIQLAHKCRYGRVCPRLTPVSGRPRCCCQIWPSNCSR